MNLVNGLLVGGAAYLLWNGYQKAQFAETVLVIFSGVEIHNLNNITVSLTIQNITNTVVTITSLNGELFLNGNEIANLSRFEPIDINANSQTVIDITIQPDLLSIVSNFTNLIQTKGSQMNFAVEGNMNIQGLPIFPFDLQKTVTI